jgi:hypothetical protein
LDTFGLDTFGYFWLRIRHLRKGKKLLWATVRHIVFLILILGREAWILKSMIRIEGGQIGVGLMVDWWIGERSGRTIRIRTVTGRQGDDTICGDRARMLPRFLEKDGL